MATPMKSNENKSRILMGSAWALTAVVSFAVGHFSNDAPIVPVAPAASGTGSAASSSSESAGVNSRAGGVFAAEGVEKKGTAPTVGEITGGQPMEAWLKRVMSQEDELFRMQNFMKLLEALNTPEDVEAALKVIMASNGGGRGRGPGGMGRFTEMSMLMSKFVQLDPKAAMAFSTKLEGGEKFMATSSALRTWTRLSPEAALAWAQTEGKDISMDSGRGGPGGEDGAPKDNFALLNVVSQLAKTDLDKALSTAAGMELGQFGDRMVDTLANEMMTQRGAKAAKSYLDSLQAGPFRDQYLQQIAGPLSKEDAAGTTKWLAGLAETGDAKRRALGISVDAWANKDLSGVGSYLSSQPVSADFDSARRQYLGELAKTDPNGAWNSLPTITPDAQFRTAQEIAGRWSRDDQAGKLAAVNNSGFTPEQKTQLLAQQGGGNRGFRSGPGGGGR